LVQELPKDDFNKRVQFCDLIVEMINDDPLFLDNIVFSDEATFELTGNVNRHNCRYWSDINPHWMKENHIQHLQKVNVWGGIFRSRPVGPSFIEFNSSNVQRHALGTNYTSCTEIAGRNFDVIYFQQEFLLHYGVNVRQYLDGIFPDRWIGEEITLSGQLDLRT